MLDLARDLSDGAMPTNMPVAHTAHERERLGPDKLLVVGVTMIPDTEPARARDTARQSPLHARCRFSFEMSHSHLAGHPNVAYDTKMRLDLLATTRPRAERRECMKV
jgi:hypothetical protein